MIKFIGNPFDGKIEKCAVPSGVKTYAQLCDKMGWEPDATLMVDGDTVVGDKSQPIKHPQRLTVMLLPQGGDQDTIGYLTGAVMIAAGLFLENPGLIAQGVLTLVGTAWSADQRKKLENQKGPEADDFDAISARLNKNGYGQPMPIFIGRGRFSPDMSVRPYQRMEGKWGEPRQITYATYTFGDAAGVTFSNFKSGDIKLAGTDGVKILTGAAVPSDSLVDTGQGAELPKPTDTPSVASFSTAAHATRVELDIVCAAGWRTSKGAVKRRQITFFLETKSGNGPWEFLDAHKKLVWSEGLGLSGTAAARDRYFRERGSSLHTARWTHKIDYWGAHGTHRRGTLGFDIPDSAEATAVRLTFEVPYESRNPRFIAELGVEQWRCFHPDSGDYSEQQRVQVQYASDGPWIRDLPPMTAAFQASVDGVPTSNPADWFREFLKRAQFPDTMIDHASISTWKTYCTDRDIQYNRVLRSDIKIADILISLCEVGHARVAPIRGKLGVILFDDNTLVREFGLDDQLKNPAMTLAARRKPKIRGLELAYLDFETLTLVPVTAGDAPYQRVRIPGITRESQAKMEVREAWAELQANYPIVTFAADDSALDLYRGQRIKVHGQRGVYTGSKICRVLAVQPEENNVKITARVEVTLPAVTNITTITPVPRGRPKGVSRAKNIRIGVEMEGGKAFLQMTWKNEFCARQNLRVVNESGDEVMIQSPETTCRHEVPLVNQLYTVYLTPYLAVAADAEWRARSLGSVVENVSAYVDIQRLADRYSTPAPKIRGLRLIHRDPRAAQYAHEFSGGSCVMGWERLRDYRIYRVRVYATYENADDILLRTDTSRVATYTYTIEKNKADTQTANIVGRTATRTLRFTVAGLAKDHTASRVGSIIVFNRLPRKPILKNYAVSPGYNEVKITTTPTDPDFMGYIVWLGNTVGFQVAGNRVDEGNCIKILEARSSSFSVYVPPGEVRYIKVAAYDDFTDNPQTLNVSDALKVSAVKLLEIGDVQSNLKIGWNQLTINGDQALVDDAGNPVYDLGDATPTARERWQQFIAAGLRGIKPPYKAWHSDLIDGHVITARSLHGDRIRAGEIEAEHLKANSSWSAFLSSNEMDVHNIYVDRYEYDANGQLRTNAGGSPVLKPGGGQLLYDYINGKISAPLGQFQHLEVEMGGLVQSFSRSVNDLATIVGGNVDGLDYRGICGQRLSLLASHQLLGLNRAIHIDTPAGTKRTVNSQNETGTVSAQSSLSIWMLPPHLQPWFRHSPLAEWTIEIRQVLYVKLVGQTSWIRYYGSAVDAYGSGPSLLFHSNNTTLTNSQYYKQSLAFSDTFTIRLNSEEVESMWLGMRVTKLEAWPSRTATQREDAVKDFARSIRPYNLKMNAMCVLNRHKNG